MAKKSKPEEEPKIKIGRPYKFKDKELAGLGAKMLEWFAIPGNIWLGDFAVENGFPRQKLETYAERSEPFRDALNICKSVQESKLVKHGLWARYSAGGTMAIFSLKNVAGWRDKQEGQDLSDSEIAILRAEASRLMTQKV